MGDDPQLCLFNSQTRKKEVFRGSGSDGRNVVWYSCGPTVYDAAHLGHARTYVAFDILRRIMRDYFGYSVKYQMNVTDVDDKIIKRARIRHLLQSYQKSVSEKGKLEADLVEACKAYAARIHDGSVALAEKRDAMARVLVDAESVAEELRKSSGKIDFDQVLSGAAGDVISEWLDAKHGSEVCDPDIFRQLSARWEREFFEDMEALGVEAPDVVTRVSDYASEIASFTESIIAKGYAYTAPSGSVYFDVGRFVSDGFKYPRLVPEMGGDVNNAEAIAQIVDADADVGREKRSPVDFVLWKAWKPGEPYWTPEGSKLAKGRPGWHIECSAMATSVFGLEPLDIHSGGIDLRFPHHDNELAQTEAFLGLKGNTQGWVRYFLHSGHLTISGLKMAKSLKNFITIRKAFEEMTPRQLRLAFLLGSWCAPMEYNPSVVAQAREYLRYSKEFYATIMPLILLQSFDSANKPDRAKPRKEDVDLLNTLAETRRLVHAALCDNIDTKNALLALRNLMGAVHSYLTGLQPSQQEPDACLLYSVGQYVAQILALFGLGSVHEWLAGDESVAPQARDRQEDSVAGEDVGGARALAVARVVADFRDMVRVAARKTKDVEMLKLCDHLRDIMLPQVGIRLEDRPAGQPAAVKLAAPVSKEELEASLQDKENEKAAEVAKKKEETAKKKEEADAKEDRIEPSVPPSKMFTDGPLASKFSQLDDSGFPTHDAEGKELTKTGIKKCRKMFDMQKKKYDAWLAKQTNGQQS